MPKLEITQLRQETPGCHQVIHFNNAGASLPPKSVVTAIKDHLDLECMMGGYEAAKFALVQTDKFYSAAAQLINCKPEEIAFCDNATRAWDMAFYSLNFSKGDKILTSESEYASNYLAFLHKARRMGLHIDVIENDIYGQLDCEQLKHKIDDRVKLIAITHVPTQGGLINPAVEVGIIAKQHNIPYILDTTQSVGQMPIDVEAIGCDFLCATGRKYLRGPRGTGFLYAHKEFLKKCNPPFIDLQSATWINDNEYTLQPDARRFETWEQNIAAKIGLKVAIEYALNLGISNTWKRIQDLAAELRRQLAEVPSITLQDLGLHKCGIVTFTCGKKSALEIQTYLASKKINVSISLQEYARLDLGKRNIPELLRASVHYYNTAEEIAIFCNEIRSIK